MTLTRRHLALAGTCAFATTVLPASGAVGQGADDAAVNQAIEDLRKAMLAADKAKLEELVSDQLSYGHSGGVIETKAQFIEVILSKKTVYKTITLSDATLAIAGPNAIARHIFSAETESGGGEAEDTGSGGGEGGAGGPTVSMKNIQFQPADISVSAGDTITFMNDEAVPHDVKKAAGPGRDFESGPEGGMQEGDAFELTLDEAGKYEYVCRVHAPGMAGTITVK